MRALLAVLVAFAFGSAHAAFPDYTGPLPASQKSGDASAVFAGGCFWGVDAVFKHVKGVKNVVSGYAGGSAATAKYMIVGTGATGHSAVAAVERLKEAQPRSIRMVCLVAAPEGIATFQGAHPDVPIYTAAIDRQLDAHGYIVPGLGDAGDRIFGTK